MLAGMYRKHKIKVFRYYNI